MSLDRLHSQVSAGYWSQISSRTDWALALLCSVVSRTSGVQRSSYKNGHSSRFSWGGVVTYLFGEPFVEGIQRKVFRDPSLGTSFVPGGPAIHFTTILRANIGESQKNWDPRPYLSDHNLMTRMHGVGVGRALECDPRPCNLEGACSPSEWAGIEDRRNRNSGGYLEDCEITYFSSNGIGARPTSHNHLLWASSAC